MSVIDTEEYTCIICFKCQMKFWVPEYIFMTAHTMGPEFIFSCPVGHKQHFNYPEEEEEPDGGGEVVKFDVVKGGKP